MSDYSLYIAFIYFITAGTTLFARFGSIKIGNFLAALIAATAFGVAAFRPRHFPDVDTYKLMYEFAASGDFNNPAYWAAHGEPGFKILSYSISLLGLDYSDFLMIMAAFSYFLLLYISRISSVPFAYLWFTYFSFFFITRDLGVIRMAIASHLIVIFFIHRKFIWQAVSITFASLAFQYFALVAVLAKPFSRVKIDWLSISLLFLISFVASNFVSFENTLIPEMQRNAYAGTVSSESGGNSIIFPVVRNLFFAFLIYFLMKNQTRFQHYKLLIWAAFLSAAIYIMTSDILIVAQRFSAYFGTAVPLALAFLMQRKSIRNPQFFLVFLATLFNFVLLFYFNSWIWQ
jgi:hypothetical protein